MIHKYHHLGRMPLRDWIHVEIEDKDETKHVIFVSRLHIGKRFPVSWTYLKTMTDEEILGDEKLVENCVDKFGPYVFEGSIRI